MINIRHILQAALANKDESTKEAFVALKMGLLVAREVSSRKLLSPSDFLWRARYEVRSKGDRYEGNI